MVSPYNYFRVSSSNKAYDQLQLKKLHGIVIKQKKEYVASLFFRDILLIVLKRIPFSICISLYSLFNVIDGDAELSRIFYKKYV